jgi:hypothetical protein
VTLRLLVIALVCCIVPRAHADEVVLALAYDAPAECPDAAHFQDEVSAGLGRNPFTPTGDDLVVALARDGIRFRGTILHAGKERAFLDESCAMLVRDLATALAVQLDPPAPMAAQVTAERAVPTVKVEVSAKQANLSLFSTQRMHLAFGPPGSDMAVLHERFAPLCGVPCTIELAPDSYHFAISQGLAAPLAVPAAMRIDHPVRIEVGYRARERVRKAGRYLGTLGSLLGGGLALWGALYDVNRPDPRSNMALVGVGCALFGTSLIAGAVMARRPDRAWLRILVH